MKTVTVYNTPNFAVVSLGNGAMYEFVNKAIDRTLFFQGDDALIFNDDMDAHCESPCPTDMALGNLWSDYFID